MNLFYKNNFNKFSKILLKIIFPFILFFTFSNSYASFSHQINSEWQTWYCYEFFITADTYNIDNWNITFDLPYSSFSSSWNLTYTHYNWTYTITWDNNNQVIYLGSTNSYWFCVNWDIKPTNIIFNDLTNTNTWTTNSWTTNSWTTQNEYYSNYTTNSWSLYFSWTRFFTDINYSTLHKWWDDLKDIKEILYQVFLLLLITNFFILIYIFYTFKNDLLWKR